MKKFLIFILLITFDLVSKQVVFNNINLNSFLSVLPILDVAHIHNYGISFGLFSGIIPPSLIIILSLIITIIIAYIMIKASNEVEKWGLMLILSGAVSNIIDRLMNHYVLDFIYIHYKDFYWPAFNFADIYITFGVLMILYQIIKEFKSRLKNDI